MTTSIAKDYSVAGQGWDFSKLIARSLATSAGAEALAARIALSVVIFPHGAQKLLGWWGGNGFSGTMGFFTETMGIPSLLAFGVIMVEFFAPLLLLVGFATRPAALAIGVVMTVAMFVAGVPNGFFMNWFGNQAGEGMEYFLLAIGLAVTIAIAGGGRWSADDILARRLKAR